MTIYPTPSVNSQVTLNNVFFQQNEGNQFPLPHSHNSIQGPFGEGVKLYEQQKFSKAIPKFRQMIAESTVPFTRFLCYSYLSDCCLAINNREEAIFSISHAFTYAGPSASATTLKKYHELDSQYPQSPFYKKNPQECLNMALKFITELPTAGALIVLSLYYGLRHCTDSKILSELYYNMVCSLWKMGKVEHASEILQSSQANIFFKTDDHKNLLEKLATHLSTCYPQAIAKVLTNEAAQFAFSYFKNCEYTKALDIFGPIVQNTALEPKETINIYKCMASCAHGLNRFESEIDYIFEAFLLTENLAEELHFLDQLQDLYKTNPHSNIAQITGGKNCFDAVYTVKSRFNLTEQIILLKQTIEDAGPDKSFLAYAKSLLIVKLNQIDKSELARYYAALNNVQ